MTTDNLPARTPNPPATSAEQPWPVRTVARKVAGWIDKLGAVWVEGQLTQVNARPGTGTAFLVLRDPAADVSLTLTCPIGLVRGAEVPIVEGSRVIVHGKPTFFLGRGTFSLRVDEIRSVGIGELLARIERLRKLLAAEGLFDRERKRRLPFLPRQIGLITGRASAAEHDVVSNAQNRWPAVRFRICHTATQGALAVAQLIETLEMLDRDPETDVIVIARGGGSVEDLLPFSDEALCRAVATARTPVVSAIGHEPDTPLLDHVADLRCSTPTAAGRTIVPDLAEESARIAGLRDRARRALGGWVDRERRLLDSLRGRPVLAHPHRELDRRAQDVLGLRQSARNSIQRTLVERTSDLSHLQSRLTSLGPAATLARGYAVVQQVTNGAEPGAGSPVLRSVADATPGTRLRIRLADGAIPAVVDDPEP
ncbi:exodeoxyribonuclease VII large subunit [Pseudonocardia spinosispora]|uniref:exodeoxyribonuclease VII large subunit n=1 Tax=Pseudonocardia spinosispora TaxID=103441 RepID=UPI0003FDFA56|nr:exodeoxyribonuclease VII large subunit [Pseudonocardia spinosispora]